MDKYCIRFYCVLIVDGKKIDSAQGQGISPTVSRPPVRHILSNTQPHSRAKLIGHYLVQRLEMFGATPPRPLDSVLN
jgi:hypothetical protein